MADIRIAIVYYSQYGHTKLQAEAVRDGAASVDDTEVQLMTADEAIARLDELDSFDAIIFGSATYMGSISAGMKKFIETTSGKWFKRAWKDKIAGGFTNSGSLYGDKQNTLSALMTNAMQHGMIWVGLGDVSAADCPESYNSVNGPGPDLINRVGASSGAMAASFHVKTPDAPASGDIRTAFEYGCRIANVTARFKRGL